MTAEDAKFILASYRPLSGDADDQHFQEALAVMEENSELKEWFEQEMELSSALTEKLGEIEVPVELRADILAGARVSAETVSKVNLPKRRWPKVLAIAACLAITGAGIFLWKNHWSPSGPETMVAYRQDMGAYMDRVFLLDYQSKNLGDVKAWLASKHGFTNYTVPAALAGRPSVGCEVIEWHGRKAYLICFDVDGELVHLFTMPDGIDLEGCPPDATPLFAQVDQWATSSWREDDRLCLVTTEGDEKFLRQALQLSEAGA